MKYLLCVLLFLFPLITNAFSWPEQVARLSLKHPVDPSLVLAITACESNFDPNAVMKNRNGSEDVGLMQINSVHWSFFTHIGLDVVNDPIDNLEAGFWLLEHNGVRDYKASSYCWKPKLEMGIFDAVGSSSPPTFLAVGSHVQSPYPVSPQ